jgi:hypothetical protein
MKCFESLPDRSGLRTGLRRGAMAGLMLAATWLVVAPPSARAGDIFCHRQRVLLIDNTPAPTATTRVVIREVVRQADPDAPADPAQAATKDVKATPQSANKSTTPAATKEVVRIRYVYRDAPAATTTATRATAVVVPAKACKVVRVVPVQTVTVREVQTTQGYLVKPKHHWNW